MAVSFVASSAWVSSATTVTPTLPTGAAAGDLLILTLVSKYDDAVLASDPTGWTSLGVVSNTGRATGNDNGNLRERVFHKVYDGSEAMPTLGPSPNNVSTAHITAYRIAAGMSFSIAAAMVKDDTAGTPLLLDAAAASSVVTGSMTGITVGDFLHVDEVLNGDVVTWGAGTLTVTGATMSASSTNTADLATATGTDMNMRSVRYTVSSGTSTAAPSLSTALAGTTTNAVGVGVFVRVREVTGPILRTQTDAEGITDPLTQESASVRSHTDVEGITDPFTQVGTYPREFTDAVGLTDSFTVEKGQLREFTDAVGLLDGVTLAKSEAVGVTDAVGLLDTATEALTSGASSTVTDAIGIGDNLTTATGRGQLRSISVLVSP